MMKYEGHLQMMKYINDKNKTNKLVSLFAIVVLVLFSSQLFAADLQRKLTSSDCRVIEETPSDKKPVARFSDAVLWKVSKAGRPPSYVFGTIHVSDPRITNLPEPVKSALNQSNIFVMEAVPTAEALLSFSQTMFYTDGTTLKEYLDDEFFHRTVKALSASQLPVEAVAVIKPWAAFLIMNFPANNTMPLDLKLFNIATSQGIKVIGLETLSEQAAVFNEMALDKQLRLLLDTVCNHDTFDEDIEEMKRLYLNKDLNGLLNAGLEHSAADEPVYKEFTKRLLTDRNKRMDERMQSALQEGNAFIAIGALHLPGDEGVLARLSQRGYKITAIY